MTPEQREELKQAAQAIIDVDASNDAISAKAYLAVSEAFSYRATPSAILSLIAQVEALTVPEKMAPVQGYKAGIPWSLHLEAYDVYSKKWSPQQALIEGGCRGGFGTGELDMFIPGWRDRASEIGRLKARIAELERAAPTIPAIPGTKEGT